MKILSGSRFQWIAYNTETRQFMGTGGELISQSRANTLNKLSFSQGMIQGLVLNLILNLN